MKHIYIKCMYVCIYNRVKTHPRIYCKLRVDPPDLSSKLETWRFLRLVVRSHFRGSRTRRKVFELASEESSGCVMHERGRCMPRKRGGKNEERREKETAREEIKMFGISFRRTRGQNVCALPLFFQKTMSDSYGRVESFWLSISGKKLFRRVRERGGGGERKGGADRWKNIAANSPSRKGSTVWSTDFLPSISMALSSSRETRGRGVPSDFNIRWIFILPNGDDANSVAKNIEETNT